MEQEGLALLTSHLGLSHTGPHAVMLTGGDTPLGIYKQLETTPAAVDENLHLLISDERHVPLDSPENNYAKMRPMIAALGVSESQVMRVRTELSLENAAEQYHRDLASFIGAGGRITLGILGLGADGHAASLFSPTDFATGRGRYAVAVARPAGPDRVSVTRDLIAKVARLVFLVAGPGKGDIVRRFAEDPMSLTAGQAVQGVADLELWFSTTA